MSKVIVHFEVPEDEENFTWNVVTSVLETVPGAWPVAGLMTSVDFCLNGVIDPLTLRRVVEYLELPWEEIWEEVQEIQADLDDD